MRYCVWVVAYYALDVVRTDAAQPTALRLGCKSAAPCVYYESYFEKYTNTNTTKNSNNNAELK